WLRLALTTLLWGGSVATILYLNLSGLGWRGSMHSDPAFAAQVLVVTLLGAGLLFWAAVAVRERFARHDWWKGGAIATGVLAAPAAVYVVWIETRHAAEPAPP